MLYLEVILYIAKKNYIWYELNLAPIIRHYLSVSGTEIQL